MCNKVVFEERFVLKYFLQRDEIQKLCDKTVDVCISALKFIPDWFVTNKMLQKVDDAVFSNDDIDFDDIVMIQ